MENNIEHSRYCEIKNNKRLENVIKATNVGTWEWNINTGEVIVNERYANIMGYELEELKDLNIHNWANYVERTDLLKSKELIDQHFKGEIEFYNCSLRLIHKSGRLIWITNRGKVINWNPDSSPMLMFGIIYDDTEFKKDEEDRLKLTMAIEQASVSVLMTSPEGLIEYVNPAYEKNTGYSFEEVIGKNTTLLEKGLNPDDVYEELRKVTKQGKAWEGELVSRRKDGSIYYEEARITPVIDYNGQVISFLSIKQDITDRKKLEEKLREASIKDALTNIYNRRYVFERLEEVAELYKRKGEIFSIAILDIDYFKNVNDQYGHPGGDFILQEFAKFIKSHIRSSDILGRYGGEEFIIIFLNARKGDSKETVNRIRRGVKNTVFKYEDSKIQFTFSAGISDASESYVEKFSFEYLINEADKRLYKAKDTGRDKVVID